MIIHYVILCIIRKKKNLIYIYIDSCGYHWVHCTHTHTHKIFKRFSVQGNLPLSKNQMEKNKK